MKNKEVKEQIDFQEKILDLAKHYNTCEIYFHADLDGVVSAICIREILKSHGIKAIGAPYIQYGEREYAVPKPTRGALPVLVDYSQGKTIFKLHVDHHDSQSGLDADVSHFESCASCAEILSHKLSKTKIFSDEDIKLISMIDSADFYKNGIHPVDVMKFECADPSDRVKFALSINKLLLSYKTQNGFLERLVMECEPSLENIFNKIKEIADKTKWKYVKGYGTTWVEGCADIKTLQLHQKNYMENRVDQIRCEGGVVIQNGGGNTFLQGSYDRYHQFDIFPDALYSVINWSGGLLQASRNPFINHPKDKDISQIKDDIVEELSDSLKAYKISIYDMKYAAEKKVNTPKNPNSIGFCYSDLVCQYGLNKLRKSKELADVPSDSLQSLLEYSMSIPCKTMGEGDTKAEFLKKIKISLYDIITTKSGGHPAITNISGLSYVPNVSDMNKWTGIFHRRLIKKLQT